MNVFERLLGLYKLNRSSGKTPLEDFVTELLVGILDTDQVLLDQFVNEVLSIKGSGFRVASQRFYPLPSDQNCIIDVVFENDSAVCFLENKVGSVEGYKQLERYKTVLKDIEKRTGKKIFLRYCTKVYDLKNILDCPFLQFRWQRIYQFFIKKEQTELITAFLELLRRENMGSVGDFKIDDILVMRGIWEVISKMDEVLDLVTPSFTEHFGPPYQRDKERLKQIPSFNRYSMWVPNYDGKDLEVMIGFEFENEDEKAAPILFVQVGTVAGNALSLLLKNQKDAFHHCDEDEWLICWFEVPLITFLPLPDQKEQMVQWFIVHMGKMKTILAGL